MPEFACFMGGAFREIRNLPERPPHIPHKKVHWFPVVREPMPPVADGEKVETSCKLIGDNYVETNDVVPKTKREIQAEKDARLTRINTARAAVLLPPASIEDVDAFDAGKF